MQIEALDNFRIKGLGHNIDFLSAIMQHPRFRSGELTTGFIAEEYPEGFQGCPRDRGICTAPGGRSARANEIYPAKPRPAHFRPALTAMMAAKA